MKRIANLASKLKATRERKSLSQFEAAIAIGTTVSSISRWECGKGAPRGSLVIQKVIEFLKD